MVSALESFKDQNVMSAQGLKGASGEAPEENCLLLLGHVILSLSFLLFLFAPSSYCFPTLAGTTRPISPQGSAIGTEVHTFCVTVPPKSA